jgi:hypothetical protein
MMNKEYICKKKKISDALNEIDSFISNMTKFNLKHNNAYNYTIDIKENKDEDNNWVIELKVNNNDKQTTEIL